MECNLHFGCPYCEGLKVMVAQSTFRDTKQDKKKKKKKEGNSCVEGERIHNQRVFENKFLSHSQ